jgi:hypothetical protein
MGKYSQCCSRLAGIAKQLVDVVASGPGDIIVCAKCKFYWGWIT